MNAWSNTRILPVRFYAGHHKHMLSTSYISPNRVSGDYNTAGIEDVSGSGSKTTVQYTQAIIKTFISNLSMKITGLAAALT